MTVSAAPETLRFLIVDDEWPVLVGLRSALEEGGHHVAHACSDLEEARAALASERPDYAICDVYFGTRPEGLVLCQELAELRIPFFLITGQDPGEVIENLRHLRPVGIICKPFTARDVLCRIQLHERRRRAAPLPAERLEINYQGRKRLLDLAEIEYVASDGAYCTIYTSGRRYTVVAALGQLTERLPADRFVRIHRSYTVNLYRVVDYTRMHVHLDTGRQLPIGRSYQPSFRAAIRTV